MKLQVQLVPETSFFKNLRSELSEKEWKELSFKVRKLHGDKCDYCGAVPNPEKREYLHCHEVWEFDDVKKTQKLVLLECVCKNCHMIHHWGLAEILDRDGKLNLKALLSHACKINECTPTEFKAHVKEQMEVWVKRSQINWQLEFNSDINKILTEVKSDVYGGRKHS